MYLFLTSRFLLLCSQVTHIQICIYIHYVNMCNKVYKYIFKNFLSHLAIVLHIFIYLELPTYLAILVFLICYYFSILLSRIFPLNFSIYLFSWLCLMTCEILFPRPGIEPKLMAEKALGPNHWTSGELPLLFNKYPSLLFFNLICSWKISDFVFSKCFTFLIFPEDHLCLVHNCSMCHYTLSVHWSSFDCDLVEKLDINLIFSSLVQSFFFVSSLYLLLISFKLFLYIFLFLWFC